MGAQALKRVVDAVQLVFRKPLLKVLLQERIHAFQLCSSALRHGYHFAALIARYMILQGVTAFAQSFQMLTYGWLLQIAKLGDPALRHLSVFESRYKIMYCPRETPMP